MSPDGVPEDRPLEERGAGRVRHHTVRAGRVAAYVVFWAVLTFVASTALFLGSSRSVVLASHDAVIRPDLGGHVVLHTGPVLPDFRAASGSRVGVDIQLGKTDAASTQELVQRYAYIASQPEGQVAKVKDALAEMAWAAVLRGAVVGLLPILVWLLLGPARRRYLIDRARSPQGALAALLVAGLVLLTWQPWGYRDAPVQSGQSWESLGDFVGPDVQLPSEADGIQVLGDVTTAQTRRLIESAVDTYDRSKRFYAQAASDAEGLNLHTPAEGDTVVALIADRHDNIGMDPVARAVADAGGATAVFDAGDDTSTGNSWEAFSLDSVNAAFSDLDRWAIAGNHDHGSFVHGYLDDRGWRMLDGTVVNGPGHTTLIGLDDPRSSGLGNWRDETGLSYQEVGHKLAEAACAEDQPVTTALVHDYDLAQEALDRGCVQLVLSGHLHVQVGPDKVVAGNGNVGYRYTNGTTGGAAYAIAVGSKLRREAELTLVTYRDGRPVGIQPVVLQTDGRFHVRRYVALHVTREQPTDLAGRSPGGLAQGPR